MKAHLRPSRVLPLAAAALSLLALAGCGSSTSSGGATNASSSGEETLVVGVPRSFGYLSTMWARNIQPAGVKVEYKYFPEFTEMLTAFNAGRLDLTEVGDVGAMQSYEAGGQVGVVAVSASNAKDCGLIVPKKSTAKTFADLKGGKIAFLKSTNSYIAFLHQLKAAGLAESDFSIVEITGPPGNKAFQTEQVAAYYSINPNMASLLEETGGREIATCEEAGVQNLYPYLATESALKTKSKALTKFVQALANTYQWIQQHPQEQAKLLAKKLDYSEASILTTYKQGAQALQPINASFYASEQKLANELTAAKVLKQPLNVEKVFLPTYNAEITANGE